MLGHQNSNFGSDISRLFGSKATRNSNPIDDFRYSYASDADAGTQFQSRGEHQWDSDNQASELLQAGNHVVFGKKGWSLSQSLSCSHTHEGIRSLAYSSAFSPLNLFILFYDIIFVRLRVVQISPLIPWETECQTWTSQDTMEHWMKQ